MAHPCTKKIGNKEMIITKGFLVSFTKEVLLLNKSRVSLLTHCTSSYLKRTNKSICDQIALLSHHHSQPMCFEFFSTEIGLLDIKTKARGMTLFSFVWCSCTSAFDWLTSRFAGVLLDSSVVCMVVGLFLIPTDDKGFGHSRSPGVSCIDCSWGRGVNDCQGEEQA